MAETINITEVPELRLCKGCFFYQLQGYQPFEICGRRAKIVNPVDGEVGDSWQDREKSLCSTERYLFWPFSWLFRTCGKRGRFWKAKTL